MNSSSVRDVGVSCLTVTSKGHAHIAVRRGLVATPVMLVVAT